MSFAAIAIGQQDEITKITAGPEPFINGSVTPESIPDDAALRVWMIAIAEPPNAPDNQIARLRSKTARMGLGEADMKILIDEASKFYTENAVHEAALRTLRARSQAGEVSPFLKESILTEHNAITKAATDRYAALLGRLTTEGSGKLQNHIAYVKTRGPHHSTTCHDSPTSALN